MSDAPSEPRRYVFDAETRYRAQRRALAIELARYKRRCSEQSKVIYELRYQIEHGMSRERKRRAARKARRAAQPATLPAGEART